MSKSVNNNSCCVSLKNADYATKAKVTTVAVLVALTAIAAVTITLLILAQHGFQLGGLNTIASQIAGKWLYLGLGIVGASAVVEILIIIAMVRNNCGHSPAHPNKKYVNVNEYSPKFIEQHLHKEIVEKEIETLKSGLLPDHFAYGRPTALSENKAVVVLVVNKNGEKKTHFCKSETAAQIVITKYYSKFTNGNQPQKIQTPPNNPPNTNTPPKANEPPKPQTPPNNPPNTNTNTNTPPKVNEPPKPQTPPNNPPNTNTPPKAKKTKEVGEYTQKYIETQLNPQGVKGFITDASDGLAKGWYIESGIIEFSPANSKDSKAQVIMLVVNDNGNIKTHFCKSPEAVKELVGEKGPYKDCFDEHSQRLFTIKQNLPKDAKLQPGQHVTYDVELSNKKMLYVAAFIVKGESDTQFVYFIDSKQREESPLLKSIAKDDSNEKVEPPKTQTLPSNETNVNANMNGNEPKTQAPSKSNDQALSPKKTEFKFLEESFVKDSISNEHTKTLSSEVDTLKNNHEYCTVDVPCKEEGTSVYALIYRNTEGFQLKSTVKTKYFETTEIRQDFIDSNMKVAITKTPYTHVSYKDLASVTSNEPSIESSKPQINEVPKEIEGNQKTLTIEEPKKAQEIEMTQTIEVPKKTEETPKTQTIEDPKKAEEIEMTQTIEVPKNTEENQKTLTIEDPKKAEEIEMTQTGVNPETKVEIKEYTAQFIKENVSEKCHAVLQKNINALVGNNVYITVNAPLNEEKTAFALIYRDRDTLRVSTKTKYFETYDLRKEYITEKLKLETGGIIRKKKTTPYEDKGFTDLALLGNSEEHVIN